MKKPDLTQVQLQQMLGYEPSTGIFTWLDRSDVRPQWNGRYAGKRAGYARQATGGGWYWSIRIFDWPFHAGPLAWLYMTGEWPTKLIDHRDGDGLNNRWGNLREADRIQNAANSKKSRANTSGHKGASFCKKARKWRATIRRDGRQAWLGYHETAEKAHAAYAAAAREIHDSFARAK